MLKFTNNFVDSEYLKKQYESGVTRCLVGFELIDRGVPRNGYNVCNYLGEKIGVVTSGTMSPSLKKAIGLAYVSKEMKDFGTEIYIKVRNKQLRAKVVSLPFYKK